MSLSDLSKSAKEIQSKAINQLNGSMKANEKHWTKNSSAQLSSLSPKMQNYVKVILKHLSTKGWHPVVVHGKRTAKEQAEKVKSGASKTTHSLHVLGEHQNKGGHGKERTYTSAQKMVSQHGPYIIKGEAADIVDARWGWEGPCKDLNHPFWNDLGSIAKHLGLVWGGDWKGFRDVAHVELQRYEIAQDSRGMVS